MELAQISNQLSASPTAFPNCCLTISSSLIDYLASLLPRVPGFTLSVGSGAGLLEALITHRHPKTPVQGVEISSSVNRYLDEPDIHITAGTWDLHSSAGQAKAWMFVYPREPALITKYINAYGDRAVQLILWLGPRSDWDDYKPCFRQSVFSDLSLPDDIGLMPYEMLAVMRRKSDAH